MSRIILKLLALTMAAHSFHSCASSPSASSSSSNKKQTTVQTGPAPNSTLNSLDCPWGPMSMHGWRHDGTSHMFAAAEKDTIFQGRVSKILNDNLNRHMPHMILLVFKTKSPKEEFVVHVGPAWYLKQHSFEVEVDDIIEITGRILNSDKSTVFATTLKKGNKALNLRDIAGRPAWARAPHRIP